MIITYRVIKLFSSYGAGLHQKLSAPVSLCGQSNRSFVQEHTPEASSSSSGDSHSTAEECKVDIKVKSSDNELKTSPSLQRRLSSRWSRLKRRLSSDHSHTGSQSESSTHTFESTEILPDDLEYIEGGDIVQEHLPHHEESDLSQSSSKDTNQSSKHTLFPVEEEKGDNTNENSASDGGSITKSPGKNKNVLTNTNGVTDSAEPVLPNVCDDTQF